MPTSKIRRLIFWAVGFTALFAFCFSLVEPTVTYAAHGGTHAATPDNVGNPDSGGVLGDIAKGFGDFMLFVFTWIAIIGITAGLFVLGIFGVFLDVALLMTFNMGAMLNQGTAAGQAVAEGWRVFRDLANLFFIAGMVWASIAMILQIQTPGGSTGKFIGNIIIAALLVNFSYFFTGVIIDASNNLSRLIYEEGVLNGQAPITVARGATISINEMIRYVTVGSVQNTGTGSAVSNTLFGPTEGGGNVLQASGGLIGSQFLRQTKLTSLFNPEGLKKQASLGNINMHIFLLTMTAAAMLTVTIQLFASLFFTIIARFAILILLLIMSPLVVFRIMNIKPFSDWGDQWWKALWSQVIFLPVFMFLIAVSFRLIGGLVKTLGSTNISFSNLMSNPSGQAWNEALGLLLVFMMGFMLLKMSKSVAESIAQGKEAEFPLLKKIGEWQGGAAKIGTAVGGFGTRVAQTPAMLARTVGNFPFQVLGSIPGVRRGGKAVARGWKGLNAAFSGEGRYELERERTAERKLPGKISDALSDIARFSRAKDAAKKTGDVQAESEAQAAEGRAKENLKKHANDLFDRVGAADTAAALSGLSGDDQRTALDALEDEKARAVFRELQRQSALKEAGAPATQGGETAASKKAAKSQEQILTELKGLRADEQKTYYREHATELRDMAAEESGANKIVAAIRENGGNLGQLPATVITSNDALVNAINASDLATLAGNLSNEEYEQVEEAVDVADRKRVARGEEPVLARHKSSPAAIAQDQTGGGDEGEPKK